MSPPHPGHAKGNSSPTRAISFAHAIREVSWEGSLSHEPQQSPVASPPAACPLTACRPVAASRRLPTFPFVMRRDGGPELVVGCKHPVIAVPVLARRRYEVREPVEKLKRREVNDAVRPRSCGRTPASRADPVGRLVSGEHVADAGDAAVFAAHHGEPLQREGRPGTVSQQMLETLKIARHVAVDERDPDAGVHRVPRQDRSINARPWCRFPARCQESSSCTVNHGSKWGSQPGECGARRFKETRRAPSFLRRSQHGTTGPDRARPAPVVGVLLAKRQSLRAACRPWTAR